MCALTAHATPLWRRAVRARPDTPQSSTVRLDIESANNVALSEATDVYHEWIDEIDTQQNRKTTDP